VIRMITAVIRFAMRPCYRGPVRSGIRPDASFPPPIYIGSLSAPLHLRFACLGWILPLDSVIGLIRSGWSLKPTAYPFQASDPLTPELGIQRVQTGNEFDRLGQELGEHTQGHADEQQRLFVRFGR
jgi:hypothetical protein